MALQRLTDEMRNIQALALAGDVNQAITAATDTIGIAKSLVNIAPDADYVLTSTPSIAIPTTGENQALFICNNSAFSIDLQDDSILTGSGISLGGAEGTIKPNGMMTLLYVQDISLWVVLSNPNAAAAGANASLLDVRNVSGGTIPAGSAVCVDGYNVGQARPTIDLADADAGQMPALGITTAAIANNANGDIVLSGTSVGTVDTSSASVNDGVWVSTTPGAVVFTRPTTGEIQRIGTVARSHATQGVVIVTGAGRVNDVPLDITVGDITFSGTLDGGGGVADDVALSVVTDATTARTLIASDAGRYIRMTNAAANTVTVPPNSTTAFAIGTKHHVRQAGAGQTTIVEGAGVTVNTEETLLARQQHSTLHLVKVGTDEWDLTGSLEAA